MVGILVCLCLSARNLLSRPPHRKRSERGRASGSEGRRKDEIRMKKDEWGFPRGGREGTFRLICGRNEMNALIGLFRSMAVHSALPKLFLAGFSGAALSVASVGIENQDVAVFAGDLDRLAGLGALVEQVESRLRIATINQSLAARPALTGGPFCIHPQTHKPQTKKGKLHHGAYHALLQTGQL